MDRRKVLEKIGYGRAAIVVSPQIINMLHSCKSNAKRYSPRFFTSNQFQFVSKIMEVIIPKTDIPGAIELKLPEFLDNYIKDTPEDNRAPVLVYSGKDLTDVQSELLKDKVVGLVKKDESSMENLSKTISGLIKES